MSSPRFVPINGGGSHDVAQIAAAAHGLVTLDANGGFVYVPIAGYTGPDGFIYRASDGAATSSPTTVSLTVAGTWSAAAALATARVLHTMTPLADGRVLVTGGLSGVASINSAEVYGR